MVNKKYLGSKGTFTNLCYAIKVFLKSSLFDFIPALSASYNSQRKKKMGNFLM